MSRRGGGTSRRATAVLLALVVTGLTACSGGGGQQSADTAFVAGDGTLRTVPVGKRENPVDLIGTAVDGSRIDAATLRGRPVVVNVWGSWCGPCRKEAPDLQAAFVELEPSGVHFVGINTGRDGAAEASAYERKYGVTYPSILDKDGRALLSLRGAIPPSAVPSTLVLDASGRVAARFSGPVDTPTLVGMVQDVEKGT